MQQHATENAIQHLCKHPDLFMSTAPDNSVITIPCYSCLYLENMIWFLDMMRGVNRQCDFYAKPALIALRAKIRKNHLCPKVRDGLDECVYTPLNGRATEIQWFMERRWENMLVLEYLMGKQHEVKELHEGLPVACRCSACVHNMIMDDQDKAQQPDLNDRRDTVMDSVIRCEMWTLGCVLNTNKKVPDDQLIDLYILRMRKFRAKHESVCMALNPNTIIMTESSKLSILLLMCALSNLDPDTMSLSMIP